MINKVKKLNPLRLLKNGIGGMMETIQQAKGSVDQAKTEVSDKCLLIHENYALMVDAINDKDFAYVQPKGFNLKFFNEHSVILKPDNVRLYLCSIDNPETFHPDYEPTIDNVDVEVIKTVFENGKEIKTYEIEKQDIKGGRILTKVAYDIFQTSILRFMEGPNRRETIFLIIICLLVGLIIGALSTILFGSLVLILMG